MVEPKLYNNKLLPFMYHLHMNFEYRKVSNFEKVEFLRAVKPENNHLLIWNSLKAMIKSNDLCNIRVSSNKIDLTWLEKQKN